MGKEPTRAAGLYGLLSRVIDHEGARQAAPARAEHATDLVEVVLDLALEQMGEDRGQKNEIECAVGIGEAEGARPSGLVRPIGRIAEIRDAEVEVRKPRRDGLLTPGDPVGKMSNPS
jgi:hypothetical protein